MRIKRALLYSGARLIRTENSRTFSANYPYIEVNGEAYNYVNEYIYEYDCANYLGYANERGSNYPGCTVHNFCIAYLLQSFIC